MFGHAARVLLETLEIQFGEHPYTQRLYQYLVGYKGAESGHYSCNRCEEHPESTSEYPPSARLRIV
jgi:hypothetical protein